MLVFKIILNWCEYDLIEVDKNRVHSELNK